MGDKIIADLRRDDDFIALWGNAFGSGFARPFPEVSAASTGVTEIERSA